MKSAEILFAGLIFLIAANGTAQSVQTADTTSLSVSISTDQNTLMAGKQLKVNADVKNTSTKVFNAVPECGQFQISVLDAKGAAVPQAEGYRQAIKDKSRNPTFRRTAVRLQPAETRKWSCTVTDMYDLSQPGEYTIQFQLGAVKSNAITVTITAPVVESGAGVNQSFSLHIEAIQDIVKAGSKIEVGIYATNTTEQPKQLDNALTAYIVSIRDASGGSAALLEPGKLWQKNQGKGGGNSVLLQPGKEAGLGLLPLSDFYDMASPGEYIVQLSRADEKTNTVVKSNTIRITITP